MNEDKKIDYKKIRVFSLMIVLCTLLIIYGIDLQDIPEIISNGSILCLTCIGIG